MRTSSWLAPHSAGQPTAAPCMRLARPKCQLILALNCLSCVRAISVLRVLFDLPSWMHSLMCVVKRWEVFRTCQLPTLRGGATISQSGAGKGQAPRCFGVEGRSLRITQQPDGQTPSSAQ